MSKLKKDLGTIQRAIQILAGTYDKDLLSFEVAQVITVDTANWLCSVQLVSGNVQTTYDNVQLTAEKASNGFIQVPKINSNVILAVTFRNERYVFMCSEVDAFVFHQANTDGSYEEFVINCNSGFNPSLPLGITLTDGGGNGINISSTGTIQINDGSFGGLVKLIDPNDSSGGVLARLNNIEKWINDFSDPTTGTFATHVHATAGMGTPSPPASSLLAGISPPQVDQTTRNQLENTNITQGPSLS